MAILKYFSSIINLLYLRYFDKITITKINTNTKIKYITLRLLIINILLYFKLPSSYFDIGEFELLNIVYENSNIKFRTITAGNLNKIKDTIYNIKLCNIEDFIKMPERDINNNPIIIKNINQIKKNNKQNIKEKIEEYIEYDYFINIIDMLDKNIEGLEIEYFLNYVPKNKFISLKDLEDIKITNIYKLIS